VAELSAAFVDAIDSQRDALNARFALRLRGGGRIDGEAFLQHLQVRLSPLVDQIAAVAPERVRAAVAALYDVSLDLFAASLLGPQAKMSWIEQVWAELLPAAVNLVARQPQQVTGSLCNAAFQIASQRGARPQIWIERMRELAPRCETVSELLEAGKVAAWQAGMVQLRGAALSAAGAMRTPLAAVALGLAETTSAESVAARLNRLREHVWLTVEAAGDVRRNSAIERVATVGAFSGFGGLFLRPPVVDAVDGRLLVSDGDSQWDLVADAYGAWLRRVGEAPAKRPKSQTAGAKIDDRGTIRWGKSSLAQPHLAGATSLAACGPTLAVTIPTSHHVFLFSNFGTPA
jgi:hypothetical protein